MDENEHSDHLKLRDLLQYAKLLLFPMSVNQQKDWVAESPLAQEISAILAKHPEYYAEFRALVGGIFPEPGGKSAQLSSDAHDARSPL
jgi:hypothetical protein